MVEGEMEAERIRPIAICACLNRDRILVAEYHEDGRLFYRPLGGTIEFGERGEETIQREFREEINAELCGVRYLGTLENIFTLRGQRGHEIVLVYDGRLVDGRLYGKDIIDGNELGEPLRAVWKGLDEFGPEKPPVYPIGLLDLLASSAGR
jgi:ADP-ribose pyrophosphatase YjhB (NUDIX family)